MKRNISINRLILICFILLSNLLFAQNPRFKFIFMTDLHIQREANAVEGVKKAISEINKLNPDFVITGGDLIMDALAVSYERADSLYNLFNETMKLINAPVYHTIGNHEIFGWYPQSKVSSDHPEYGKKMFEKRIGKTYRTFEHKGWKFFILDSIEKLNEEGKYEGRVNAEQISWLKNELSKTDKGTPIVVVTHIPFITALTQIQKGSLEPNTPGLVISNSLEVLSLFKEHNLKLVLQGHLHILEEINFNNRVRFLTGGAVSGRWWAGPNNGLEEGFVIVNVDGENLTYEYFDYGWDVKK